MNDAIKARWSALPANARTVIAISALFLFMVAVAMALGVTGTRKRNASPGEQVSMTNLSLPGRSAATVEQVVGRVDATQDKVKQLEQQLLRAEEDRLKLIKQFEESRAKPAPDNATVDLAKEVLAMRKEFELMKNQAPTRKTAEQPSLDDPLSEPKSAPVPEPKSPELKVIVGEPAPSSVAPRKRA